MNSVLSRRSIRAYINKTISENRIYQIIKAAMYAPSAHNQQPWEFIIIDNRKLLSEISSQSRHAFMASSAPIAILVCINNNFVKHMDYAMQDCSAATQNMLIQIREFGLGGVWVGVTAEESLSQFFKRRLILPEFVTPFSLVVFGYPAEVKSPHRHFKIERIHKNQW